MKIPLYVFLILGLISCSDSNKINNISEITDSTQYTIIENFETLYVSKDFVVNLNKHNLGSVKIDNKIWMKKNLNTGFFSNGDKILKVTSHEDWEKSSRAKTPVYCSMNFNERNDSVFGKLYNWYAVNDERGLAPNGWHVASKEEWENLINKFGGDNDAGSSLKIQGNSLWMKQIPIKTINANMYLLPGGYQYEFGHFGHIGKCGYWWTSSKYDFDNACFVKLRDTTSKVEIDMGSKGYGLSVRCVKN